MAFLKMETCVMIPQELALSITSVSTTNETEITVWTTTDIKKGSIFYPFQGTIRIDKLEMLKYLDDDDPRYRYGLYDEVSYNNGHSVRHCNWIRFLRVAHTYDSNVNVICIKVKGDPLYEVVKPITTHQELVVYYLPERPEDIVLMRLRSTLYRQTMYSLLQDTPLDLSLSLMHTVANLPVSPSASEDEQKSILSDSSGSLLSFNDTTNDNFINASQTSINNMPTSLFENTKNLNNINNNNNNNNNNHSNNTENNKCQTPKRRTVRNERSLLPCDVCKKAFDRPSLLKRHMRTHTGEKPHVCLVCSKGFSTSSSLNTHRRIHSGEKPHQCQVCGKRFTASSNLYYHRMTHIKEKPHKCKLCSKSFPTPGDLRSHMYLHTGSWPFKCQICFRGFSKQTNLKNHLFLHTGEKPYGCKLCKKKFALACNFRAHMKTHEGDPQDECGQCGKMYVTAGNNTGSKGSLCERCSDLNDATYDIDKTGFHSERGITTEEEYEEEEEEEEEYESSNGATEYSDK